MSHFIKLSFCFPFLLCNYVFIVTTSRTSTVLSLATGKLRNGVQAAMTIPRGGWWLKWWAITGIFLVPVRDLPNNLPNLILPNF